MAALRRDFNLYRKLWHMLGLLLPLFFYLDIFSLFDDVILHATRFLGVMILVLAVAWILFLDLLRFNVPAFSTLFMKFIGPLMKAEEKDRINGTAPYMLGNLFLFLFFSREIVILASLFLMIGDPVAAYMGIFHGKHRFRNGKSLEGFLGFLVAGFLGGLIFLILHSLFHGGADSFVLWREGGMNGAIVGVLVAGSLLAATGEFFSGNYLKGMVDDNLIVPVIGAVTMAVVGVHLLGISADRIFFDPTRLCDANAVCDLFR